MTQRHRDAYSPETDRPTASSSVAPGKRTLTARLARRPADARDGSSVAAGADAAVEQAATDSGAPLRADLRERFEGSLGADLSAVRVHTGDASAEAASAVGARAYAVGNDIHFGAGHYQPDDPFGLHLIAHEVAHTVQQAGGAPHRKDKLEVSVPGDAAEVEADRAADAMVAGASFALSAPFGGGLSRQPAAPAKADAPAAGGDPKANEAAEAEKRALKEYDAELRRQAGNRMDRAFTKYVEAGNQVRKELEAKEKKQAEPSLFEQLLELAVGTMAPGYGNIVSAVLKDRVKKLASEVVGTLVSNGDLAVKTYIKVDELVDKHLTVDESTAKAGFGALKKALTATKKGDPNALIIAVIEEFSQQIQDIDATLPGLDRSALLAVYAAFDAQLATIAHYTAAIRDLVGHHEEMQEAEHIVLLDAWGQKAPAYIGHSPLSVAQFKKEYYYFKKWVPKEMRQAAMDRLHAGTHTTHKGLPQEIDTSMTLPVGGAPGGTIPLQGHIDDPRTEGEKIVKVDAWGKYRYVVADLEGGKARFVRWYKDDEASYAEAAAARQPGGPVTLDGSAFDKLPKPD